MNKIISRVHLRHEKCRFGPSRFSFELQVQTERTQRSAEERATKNPVKLWWLCCLDSALTPPNCIFLCKSICVAPSWELYLGEALNVVPSC